MCGVKGGGGKVVGGGCDGDLPTIVRPLRCYCEICWTTPHVNHKMSGQLGPDSRWLWFCLLNWLLPSRE